MLQYFFSVQIIQINFVTHHVVKLRVIDFHGSFFVCLLGKEFSGVIIFYPSNRLGKINTSCRACRRSNIAICIM